MKKKLKKLGKILHPSVMAPNIVIAKINEFVEPGTIIYDEGFEKIGTIVEVFGPVSSPYARIKVNMPPDEREKLRDKPVLIIVGDKTKVRWRKMPGYKRMKRNLNRGKRRSK